jgi:hypothetical protein
MSEMNNFDNDPQARLRVEVAEHAKEQIGLIETTALEIGGADATVETVFELPPQVRDEALSPAWDDHQEAIARELGDKLGYASERDVVSPLVGIDFVEGGKVWKILAEIEAASGKMLMISGSPYRVIGEDEKDFLVDRYTSRLEKSLNREQTDNKIDEFRGKLEGKTEYDIASDIAEELVATEPFVDISDISNPNRSTLPYGYAISDGNPVVTESTSQFIHIGKNAKDQEVVLMRIDREDYVDETGKAQYRFQPDPLRRMGIIADVLSQQGDQETPIVFVTSNAYASRQIDTIRAGLSSGRQYGVTMYGRGTLAAVKNEPIMPGARINQLPGDIRLMYDGLKALYAEATN